VRALLLLCAMLCDDDDDVTCDDLSHFRALARSVRGEGDRVTIVS